MDVTALHEILSRANCLAKVVIVIQRPGSIGSTPCVEIESVHAGFDWDNGNLMIYPAKPLTALTTEDVDAIHESVKKGQSWHAWEAHKAIYEKRREAELERDEYKLDAERHRFGRALLSNIDLQVSLERHLGEWARTTPDAATEGAHDAQVDHMISTARAAGLWPLKTEGEAA